MLTSAAADAPATPPTGPSPGVDVQIDARLLSRIPLFSALDPDALRDLSQMLTIRHVSPNQPLFWIGDAGDEFYIVHSGHLTVSYPDDAGQEITAAVLKHGDFLGEISLLDGGPRTMTARARDAVTLYCLTRSAFLEFLRVHTSAAVHAMKVLGQRQRESVEKLRGIRNVNEVVEQNLTHWQRLANTIADVAASRMFLGIHLVAFLGWIVLNLILPADVAPDPYPFPFLCFWSSTEAIFLSLFILISQNVQSGKDRVRAELDYQTASKVHSEIIALHRKIDALSKNEADK